MKDPIDLSAIQAKITARAYGSAWEYLRDMDLMFENDLSYNKAGSFHYKYAQSMKAWWIPRASATITEDLCKWRARVHERERESVCVCVCVCVCCADLLQCLTVGMVLCMQPFHIRQPRTAIAVANCGIMRQRSFGVARALALYRSVVLHCLMM